MSRSQTGKKIVVLDEDEKQCRSFCAALEAQDYQAVPIHTLSDLEKCLKKLNCLIIIIDLDTVVVDNRIIRELTIQNPGV